MLKKEENKEKLFLSKLANLISKEWKIELHLTPSLLKKIAVKLKIHENYEKLVNSSFSNYYGNVFFRGFNDEFEDKKRNEKIRKFFWRKIFWAEDVYMKWINRRTDVTVNKPPSVVLEKTGAGQLLREYENADEFLRDELIDIEKKKEKQKEIKKRKNLFCFKVKIFRVE